MNRREIDMVELGQRVERYLYIDNELRRGARLAALTVRFAEALSKEGIIRVLKMA
jgi:hypothetical protein